MILIKILILWLICQSNAFRIANIKTNRYIDSSNFGDVYLNTDEYGSWSNWIPIKTNNTDGSIYLKNFANGHYLLGRFSKV